MASKRAELPRILFFNINGSGMGHWSRCLAYARRMPGRAVPVFFSLASAIEIIQDMGLDAHYFDTKFRSRYHINAWNRELALRLGLMLEEVRPAAVVFDGTWPFHGFMDACDAYGVSRRVWSRRGLHKPDMEPVPVPDSAFDLVIEPGEFGSQYSVLRAEMPGRRVSIPPVTLLDNSEFLDRNEARDAIGLKREGRYALFSLGPGNLKDVGEIARGLVEEMGARGHTVVWARAPISVRDPLLPEHVVPISVYPLARYMRAFDLFAGAAGYNTCCEVIQSGVPSLLVPNTQVSDDQARRAAMVADHARVVVSSSETAGERAQAVARLLAIAGSAHAAPTTFDLSGAERAADEILALAGDAAA
jgi:UDP:flavonoid glycosyltransferase YjiC (YdhE family)